MYISRRSVIKTSFSVAGGILAEQHLLALVTGQQAEEKPPTLVAVDDPSAYAALDAHFPGIRELPDFAVWARFTYLLTNPSSAPVFAFATEWRLTKNNQNAPAKVLLHYFRPQSKHHSSLHWSRKGNRTRYTGGVPVLRSGAVRLISPFFAFSPEGYRTRGEKRLAQLRKGLPSRHVDITYLDFAESRASVTASIAGTVLMSGQTSGSAAKRLAAVLTETRNGEHDEAWAIAGLLRNNATPEQVRQVLTKHASGLAFNVTPRTDLYFRVRQREAKILLRRLRHGTWPQFTRTISYLRKMPRLKLAA